MYDEFINTKFRYKLLDPSILKTCLPTGAPVFERMLKAVFETAGHGDTQAAESVA